MSEVKKQEESQKPLKTWDEAFKELREFIKISKATEVVANNESKQS